MMRAMMGNKNYQITITTNGSFEHDNIGLKINDIDVIDQISKPTVIGYKKGDVLTFYDIVGFASRVTVDGVDHNISYGGSYSFVATGLHTINIESWGKHAGGAN